MDMHRAEFRAAMKTWHRLAGIEQALRVEDLFHCMKLFELGALKLNAHLIDFLDPDSMLTRNRTTDRDAKFQNIAAEAFGALKLAGLVRIVQN